MKLNHSTAIKILKDAEAHRLAEPVYITRTDDNLNKNAYGEFYFYPPDSPILSSAKLFISPLPIAWWYRSDPFTMGAKYIVPAILGLEANGDDLKDILSKFPEAKFSACYFGHSDKRAWRLHFRDTQDCERIAIPLGCRFLGKDAWFYSKPSGIINT